MDGIINVYKEKGFTSHDVVAKLRGILKQKKIGHTGTLDPDATGVLPVCLGKGTKVCDLLTNKDKTYQARVRLGVVTDTQDMSGTILEQKDVNVSKEVLIETVNSFVGQIKQVPPMYSALKVNGKKLYELARAGIEVERKARDIEIFSISLGEMDITNHWFDMTVECSKGTYIRTLCNDIGAKLGCGAAMESLVRTQVGDFVMDEALTLSEIENLVSRKDLSFISAVDSVFMNYSQGIVKKDGMKYLINGNEIPKQYVEIRKNHKDNIVRVYDEDGIFYALYQDNGETYKVVKMFH